MRTRVNIRNCSLRDFCSEALELGGAEEEV